MWDIISNLHVILHWVMIIALAVTGVAIIVDFPNRLGMGLGMAVIAVAAGFVVYDEGYRSAMHGEEVAELQAQIAQKTAIIKEREKEAADAAIIAQNSAKRAENYETLANTLQEKVDAYAKQADKDPCVATDADVRGLQFGEPSGGQARPAAPSPFVRHPLPPPRPFDAGR